MNIRRTLTTITLVISAALLATGGQLLYDQQAEIIEKGKTVKALEVLGAMNEGLMRMSLERSVVQVTSNLPDKIAPGFLDILVNQRKKVDESFDKSLTLLDEYKEGLEKPEYMVDAIHDTKQQLKSWREKADIQLGKPLAQRDPEFIRQWPIEVPAIIEKAANKRIWLNIQAKMIPPKILALQELKFNLWRIREYGGRDRTYMAIAAARQEPLPKFFLDTMERLQGPVNRSRAMIESMQEIGLFQDNKQIDEIINQAEEAYFGDYTTLRENFIKAGKAEQIYPISFGDFFKLSSEALTAIENAHAQVGEYAFRYLDSRQAQSYFMLWYYILCIVITTVLSAYMMHYVAKRVGRRLQDLAVKTEQISQGDYGVDLSVLDRKDEIGTLAKATEILRQNSARAKELEEETQALQRRAAEDQKNATLALADSFEQKIGSVSKAVSLVANQLQQSADSLSSLAAQTSRQADSASVGSMQTSNNVQTVASATEELSASVSEINRQVTEATRITTRAVSQAQKTDQTIQGLADAAKKIDEVVGLINAIASQTNLLALNATIEAARAGEAGKGFAVVASEVKTLAQETARATEDIANQVSAIQGETTKAVEAIKDIGATIEEVNRIATVIASAVEQQGSATQEISRNVQEAARGTNEVTTSVESVRSGASETTKAANDLQQASAEVNAQGQLLSQEMERLLKHLRAA